MRPGWSIFLACSWTWCIGLYLPVVLLDTYGWAAVVAFALPNLIGAVLFGWIISRREESVAVEAGQRAGLTWFSIITIAFHVHFLGALWIVEFGLPWPAAMLVPLPAIAAAWAGRGLSDRALLRVAGAVYAVSMLLLIVMLVGHFAEPGEWRRTPVWTQREPAGLIFVLPIFVLGFLLCPYLDPTFHRALRATGGGDAGRHTFLLFGGLFAAMLGFTALYAVAGLRWPVILHILIQSWFTMTLHWREVGQRARSMGFQPVRGGSEGSHGLEAHAPDRLRWAIVGAWLLIPLPFVDYRHWFVFYGLVFPAYVVATMVRPRLGRQPLHGATTALLVLAMLPFGYGGFILGLEWLLLVPAATLVLVPLIGPAKLMRHGDIGAEGVENTVDVSAEDSTSRDAEAAVPSS